MEDQLGSIVLVAGAFLVTVLMLAFVCESGDDEEER
jgi:hypothetical protein